MGACESGQVRKEAALSGYFYVPRGRSDLRPYRDASSAELGSALFLFFLLDGELYNIIFVYALYIKRGGERRWHM